MFRNFAVFTVAMLIGLGVVGEGRGEIQETFRLQYDVEFPSDNLEEASFACSDITTGTTRNLDVCPNVLSIKIYRVDFHRTRFSTEPDGYEHFITIEANDIATYSYEFGATVLMYPLDGGIQTRISLLPNLSFFTSKQGAHSHLEYHNNGHNFGHNQISFGHYYERIHREFRVLHDGIIKSPHFGKTQLFVQFFRYRKVSEDAGRIQELANEVVNLQNENSRLRNELENNTPEPVIIRSPDFDNDGTVGFSDFVAFAQCFGKSGLEILTCFLTENN